MKSDKKTDLTILNFDNIEVELKTDIENETLWGTAEQISQIFSCSTDNIYLHVKNILQDGELTEESSVSRKRDKLYNLDMMIAIGYRVNSKKAIITIASVTLILIPPNSRKLKLVVYNKITNAKEVMEGNHSSIYNFNFFIILIIV